ncbi:MAG: uracil-DNA glycosylase family protein [Alphaproteobacteria bacterium]
MRQGRPFVGRSGQLLDKALAEAGIERPASFIANVFRYQPPGNKGGPFLRLAPRGEGGGRSIG